MKTFARLQAGLILLTLVNMTPALEVDGAWWLMLLALFCALGALILTRPQGGTRVPGWMVVVGVMLSVAYSVREMLEPQTVHILDLAHFIILLGCCKFFELRTHRDMGLVLLICFLLLIISAFVSASPLFGIVVLVDVTAGLSWIMRFQADRELAGIAERRRARLSFTGPQPQNPEPGEMRTVQPALSFGLIMAVIAGAVFICVPRGWGKGFLGRLPQAIPIGVTSFTDEIQLRDATILEDQSLVMRAKFTDGGQVIGGEDFQPYLRGVTFDRYRNGRWRRTRQVVLSDCNTNRDGVMRSLPNAPSPIADVKTIDQEIWLEATPPGVLFSLYPPLMISSKEIRRVQQAQSDLTLDSDEQMRGGYSYHVASAARGSTFTRYPDAPPPRRNWPTYSTIHPAIRQFTREVFAPNNEYDDPRQHPILAQRVCTFLRSGDFQYSLKRQSSYYEGDRVVDFLFHNSLGHCEYFASTMALMCQSMNIPCRVVSGFCGGEFNSVGGFYQFRAKDAHAWVEVWIAGRGWVTYDPSPAVVVTHLAAQSGLWDKSRRFADFFRFRWSTTVVSFDAASRQELFENLDSWLRLLVELRPHANSLGEIVGGFLWGPEALGVWQRMVYWIFMVLMAILIFLTIRVLWILSLIAREFFLSKAGAGRLTRRPEARFYDRLLLLLANKGYVKPTHQTPREFAAELAATHRDLAGLPRLTEWFYQAQYAGRAPSREESAAIKNLLVRLREDPAFAAR